MNPRWAGFTAPFRWLIDAVDVGRHQPQAFLGAVIATAVVGLLPSLPAQMMAMAGSSPGAAVGFVTQGLSMLMGLLVLPVMRAGIYRVLDGAERGQPVRASQVFDGFSDGSLRRIVGLSLLSALLFVGVLLVMTVIIALLVGSEGAVGLQAWGERLAALSAQAEAGTQIKPDQFPEPPPGFGAVLGVLLAFAPLGLFIALGSAWGLVSVALRGASPVEALVGGLRAAFVNAVPVLGLAVVLLLPTLLIGSLVMLVLGAAMALVSLISPALGMAVMLLLMLALGIVLAAISYGFVLNGWRAACDDGAEPSPSGDRPGLARIEA